MFNNLKVQLDNISLLKKGVAVLCIPFFALIISLILVVMFEMEATKAQKRVAHTLEVQATIYKVRSLLTDAETGARGYILFGSPSYLEPFNSARSELKDSIATLSKLTSDRQDQTSIVKELHRLSTVKVDALETMLDIQKERLSANTQAVISSRATMATIRDLLTEMEKTEARLLSERDAAYQEVLKQTNTMLAVLFMFAIVCGLLSWYVVFNSILKRIKKLEEYATKVIRNQPANWNDSGSDEIGFLGRNIEIMTNNLLNREQTLGKTQRKLEEANTGLEVLLDQTRAANQELEAFSYSVSHDLRAPLRHVAGFSELMLRNADSLDAKNRRYLDIISSSIRQMGVLIDELLAFSRMGRTAMKSDPVDLNSVINDVLNDFSQDITSREIEWNIDPLPVVRGDRIMIQLVFQNLIGNAIKYTRNRDRAVIEIKAKHIEESSVAEIRFCDNGVGFDAAYSDKLFGVFQRLHNTEDYEGTGIGLATVRRIVTRHGGNVSGVGEVDKGAEFTITLPSYSER